MSLMEIVIILIVAILVLGPEKLPGTIIEVAKFLKAVKKQINEAKSSIENEINISELKDEARKYKEEIEKANDSIRKKLSFEEFDEIKQDLNKLKDDTNETINNIARDVNLKSDNIEDDKISKREQFLKEKSENV